MTKSLDLRRPLLLLVRKIKESCLSVESIFLRRPSSHVSFRYFSSAGMKTTVSEAEHPLLCEGTRRVKGDLALALMITYKDDQSKLKKVAA